MIIHCVNQTACERDRKLCRLSSNIKRVQLHSIVCGFIHIRGRVYGIDIIYGDMRPTNWQHNKL